MGRGMGHQWELNREEVYPLMYPVLCVSVWDSVISERAYSHTGHRIGYLSLLQQNKRLEQFKGKEYFVSQLRVWSLLLGQPKRQEPVTLAVRKQRYLSADSQLAFSCSVRDPSPWHGAGYSTIGVFLLQLAYSLQARLVCWVTPEPVKLVISTLTITAVPFPCRCVIMQGENSREKTKINRISGGKASAFKTCTMILNIKNLNLLLFISLFREKSLFIFEIKYFHSLNFNKI